MYRSYNSQKVKAKTTRRFSNRKSLTPGLLSSRRISLIPEGKLSRKLPTKTCSSQRLNNARCLNLLNISRKRTDRKLPTTSETEPIEESPGKYQTARLAFHDETFGGIPNYNNDDEDNRSRDKLEIFNPMDNELQSAVRTYEMQSLEEKISELKEEVGLQTERAEQMKNAYLSSRLLIAKLNSTIESNQTASSNLLINETNNWGIKIQEAKVKYNIYIL